MNYQEYIRPELLVLVPVLYLIGTIMKKSRIRDSYIPLILGLIGIILSAVCIFSMCETHSVAKIFEALFTSVTQGIMTAGTAV